MYPSSIVYLSVVTRWETLYGKFGGIKTILFQKEKN